MASRPVGFGRVLFVLVLATSVSILATDLYAPSLPHLPAFFSTTPEMVKLTMSLNLIAFGLAQLVHGPLSDRYGRRPVMLAGMAGLTLCSLACALSQSIAQLIVARILQGIAVAVEAVIALAMIQELFSARDRVRALALWGMAISLAPAVGPVLGGYIHVGFGWRANFLLLAALGLVTTFLVWQRLPETTRPDAQALKPRQIAGDYWRLLCNRRYLKYVLLEGVSLGSIFAFITAAPFILITQFGVATQHYGLYQAATVFAYLLGALVAERLAGRLSEHGILRLGLIPAIAGGLLFPALVFTGRDTPVSLTAAMAFVSAGVGLVFAVAPALAMSASRSRVGAAAAMLGAVEMLISGAAAAMVGILHDGTSRPLALTMVGLLLLGALASCLAPAERTVPKKAKKVSDTDFG